MKQSKRREPGIELKRNMFRKIKTRKKASKY